MTSTEEKAIARLIDAGLGDVLYARGQERYHARNESYWSLTPRLKPWAIVQPRNTEEVSKAVKALVGTQNCKFAIRSGGHMAWSGANNIDDGITIDLGLMNKTTYDPETQVASLQPGGTWTSVYKEVEKHGRMVAGGRESTVGVGGLLLGGGKTFHTCRVGFACDNVLNYEVVLADGSIVNANEADNSDLFRALKGGGNNFGIVTRFDMSTFAFNKVWDGTRYFAKEESPAAVNALCEFTTGLNEEPDSHAFVMWIQPYQASEHIVLVSMTGLDGLEDLKGLKPFLDIPGQGDMKMTTVGTKLETFVMPSGKEDTWLSLAFKNDKRVVNKVAEAFPALIKRLQGQIADNRVTSSMVMQPLPVSFGKHSTAKGGNMFGLERIQDDCILMVWALELDSPEEMAEYGFPAIKQTIDELEAFARELGADVPFRYLNYCDGSQDPLGSYGEENVKKMKAAAARYDPTGVFQTRVPGGFKISKVAIP